MWMLVCHYYVRWWYKNIYNMYCIFSYELCSIEHCLMPKMIQEMLREKKRREIHSGNDVFFAISSSSSSLLSLFAIWTLDLYICYNRAFYLYLSLTLFIFILFCFSFFFCFCFSASFLFKDTKPHEFLSLFAWMYFSVTLVCLWKKFPFTFPIASLPIFFFLFLFCIQIVLILSTSCWKYIIRFICGWREISFPILLNIQNNYSFFMTIHC